MSVLLSESGSGDHDSIMWDWARSADSYMPWTAIRQMRAVEQNMWVRLAAPQLAFETRAVLSGLVSTAGAGAIFILNKQYPGMTKTLCVMARFYSSSALPPSQGNCANNIKPKSRYGLQDVVQLQSSSDEDADVDSDSGMRAGPPVRLSILGPRRRRMHAKGPKNPFTLAKV
jgi:hypothetical protein